MKSASAFPRFDEVTRYTVVFYPIKRPALRYMSTRIHQSFLEISAQISPKLRCAIEDVGPKAMKRPSKQPVTTVLCRSITGQQLSTKAATTIWQRLLDQSEGKPLIEYLDHCEIQALRQCGLSNSKAKCMKSIVDAWESGLLDPDKLRSISHAERSTRLTSIWGVGQWTADMMGIFYFADKDIWPDGDLAVWKTLEKLTSRRRKTARTAAQFAPNRSYLAIYMWAIANNPTQY